MPVTPKDITEVVNVFTDFLLRYFIALAAVGALSMALIELWKKLRDSRTRFHARAVVLWIRQSDESLGRSAPDRKGGTGLAAAQLLSLTTGIDAERARSVAVKLLAYGGIVDEWFWLPPHPEYAVFALQLERMMGHLQDAGDAVLNSPSQFRELYYIMTAGAEAKDVAAWFEEADALPNGEKLDRAQSKRRADLYGRLHQVVKRKLDALQVYTDYRWATWNQFWANIVGTVLLLIVLLMLRRYSSAANENWLSLIMILPLSLLGGMLAPIAKDIVVALQRVREGG